LILTAEPEDQGVMKIQASAKSGVALKTATRDWMLPAISLPELQLKNILLRVDFSECSRKVLRYTTRLAKQFNAEVLLLHVVEVVPLESQAEVPIEAHKPVERKLFEWRKEFAAPGPVQMLVRDGFAAHEQILEAAADYNCDLIVVGNHGRTGFHRMLLGSTAEKVVRHARCPVLIIREHEHEFISVSEEETANCKSQ
jgi:universal stress protein A